MLHIFTILKSLLHNLQGNKPFFQHLFILRRICIIITIFFLFIFGLNYILLKKYIINIFVNFIHNTLQIPPIIYFSVYDGFLIPFKLMLYISFIFSFILLCCILFFLLKLASGVILLVSFPLCVFGISKYFIPIVWKSFYSIIPIYGSYMVNLPDVFSFVKDMFICGLITFYTPFVIFFLYYAKILSLKILNIIRKFWIFTSILISGIFAPADIISHLVMSFIMILLFESLFFSLRVKDFIQKFYKSNLK